MFVESAALANDGTNRWVAAISDGTNFERVQIIYLAADNTITASVINNNTSQCSFTYSSGVATDFNKIAILYKQNDFKLYVNGTQIDSDTSGNPPSGLDTLGIERPTGVSQFYGKTKQLMYFDEALSDEELSDLTGQVNLSFNNLADILRIYNIIIMAEPTIQLGGGNWAGKTDNLLGYYKEGERFYKQDFTFSRSTTGTYTDSGGLYSRDAV